MINIQNEFQSIIDSGYPYESISNWDESSFSINKINRNIYINSVDVVNQLFEISDNYKLFAEIFNDFKNISISLIEKYPENIKVIETDSKFKIQYTQTKPKEKEKNSSQYRSNCFSPLSYRDRDRERHEINSEIERFKQNYFSKFKKL